MAAVLRAVHPRALRERLTLRIRARAIAFAVVAGLAIAVSLDVARAGSPSFWLSRHGWTEPYVADGGLVDLGDRSLYLDCRGSGSPTVIFEAGAGGDSSGWGVVFRETVGFTRACVYDRAGFGRSQPDPAPDRTAVDVVDDLAALLTAASEEPPYVLVGHSLGGVYVRIFAARNRDDVAGIVLDDAFNPDLFEGQVDAAPERVRSDWLADMAATFDLIEQVEGIDWEPSAAELAGSSVDGLPVEVVVSPRRDPRLSAAEAAAVDRAAMAALETLSSDTRITIADGAGHFIHLSRPDLILDSIRRLVERARG